MLELSGRKLHLVKKALAIAVASVERMREDPFRSDSDLADMKALLDEMNTSDTQLAHYMYAARIAFKGNRLCCCCNAGA
jgi:hypothetical protein